MSRIHRLARFTGFFLTSSVLAASSQTFHPSEPLRLSVDCGRFRGPDDLTEEVELYYSFPQRGLTYVQDSAGMKGALDLTVTMVDRDSVVYADRWLVPHVVSDTALMTPGMNLIGVYRFAIGPGDYVLHLYGRDRDDLSRADSVAVRLPVKLSSTTWVTLSDIEFASTIKQDVKTGPFSKNTLEVVPNVGGIYGGDQPCFFYTEAYNLLLGGNTSDLTIRTSVFDAIGREIISKERQRKRAAESTVIIDNVNISRLRSGTYTLMVALQDTGKRTLVSSSKKFFVYNTKLGVDSTLAAGAAGLPMTVYLAMDEKELDREFSEDRYEATDGEKDQYDQLKGVDAKRKFLSDFWRRRPAGTREEYLSRVSYTNRSFGMMGRPGFRTDRGRVYIVYGPPDDVDRHPNETDMKPYEIWTYHSIEGGVIFVFVQRNSGGQYELVHSTARNELHDENWDRPGITR